MSGLSSQRPFGRAARGTSPGDLHGQQAASFILALKLNRPLRLVAAFMLGVLVTLLIVVPRVDSANEAVGDLEAAHGERLTGLEGEFEKFSTSCEGKGICKVFPFARANQISQLYALMCFNYSAQSSRSDQPQRLSSVPGAGDSCGWNGEGSGTVTSTIPNSEFQLNVPSVEDPALSDSTLGITGVTVVLAGQTDPLNFVSPISATADGVSVASAGALYTSRPNTLIRDCSPDSVFSDASAIQQRIQQLEAGRVGAPNVDPQDYLMPDLMIGRFGPSITDITVTGVTVCQGSSDEVRNVVARERFAGPTPGSYFDFVLGYVVQKVDDKWFVKSWGPVLDPNWLQG